MVVSFHLATQRNWQCISIRNLQRSSHLIIRPRVHCRRRRRGSFAGSLHLEMDLTSSQWSLLAPLVAPDTSHTHRGRPYQDTRAVLNGIFWVLRTGTRWSDLPDRYPPYQTCHRRFREWLSSGAIAACFRALDAHLPAKRPKDNLAAARTSTSRSWIWHTTQLLQCSYARQVLMTHAPPPVEATSTIEPSRRPAT